MHSLHVAVAKELCVLLVCHSRHGGVGCRSSVTSFCYFPIVNWKRVSLHDVGPIKNKPVSCLHSSYSLKQSSGFKVFMWSDDFSYECAQWNCVQALWGPLSKWGMCQPGEHLVALLHTTCLARQTEAWVSIRTHFLPVQTCIIRLTGESSSCCRYWTASLLLSNEIHCLGMFWLQRIKR